MITEKVLTRPLMGGIVRQKSKSEMFSASDLLKVGNRHRAINSKGALNFYTWVKSKRNVEFIDELKVSFPDATIIQKRKGDIWMHPYLFISLAMDIDPKFKVQAISWLYDYLIKYRNASGDSYKLMSGSIMGSIKNKKNAVDLVKNTARRIKAECEVTDWDTATADQLELRNDMHKNISWMTDIVENVDKAIEIGISKTLQLKKDADIKNNCK